jgi:ParB family chromosome partitioning protein
MTGRCDLAKQIGASPADSVKVKLRREIFPLSPAMIEPDPEQPRKECDEKGLARLADSLRKLGQLQPILVRKEKGGYVIVAGERRWRAAKLAGMATVEVLLWRRGDPRSVQLVENLLREDLKPVEQARAYAEIMKKEGWSARELARQLHIEQSGISRALNLLKLDPKIQVEVDGGQIPPTTAYEIARRPREEQTKLAREVAAGRIKGDDLRRRQPTPAPAPVVTLGEASSWIYQVGNIQVTVTGHRSHDEVMSALEGALNAARSGKRPLAGGLGRAVVSSAASQRTTS